MLYFLQAETSQDSFTGPSRPRVREILFDLIPRHGKVTYTALEAEWRRRELPQEGLDEIRRMSESAVPLENWGYNLEQVRKTQMRRETLRKLEVAKARASDGSSDAELLSELASLSEVAERYTGSRDLILTGPQVTPLVRRERVDESRVLIDLRMGSRFPGIRRGELMTVIGRMWTGKSLWASQAVLNSHAATLIVSLEMPAAQWWRRMLAQLWGISLRQAVDAVTYGNLTPEQAATLSEVEKRISITKECDGSWPSIQAAFQRTASTWGHPPALVVIDHLDYIRTAGRFSGETERLGANVRECQRFARRKDIALLLISQVGRAEGADGSTELGLQSARGTGKVEEDSAHLLGIWRPAHRKGLEPDRVEALKPEMRGRLLKQRDGGGFPWNFRLDPLSLRINPEDETRP
jgi:replicative DNA helicase